MFRIYKFVMYPLNLYNRLHQFVEHTDRFKVTAIYSKELNLSINFTLNWLDFWVDIAGGFDGF